MHIEHSVFLSWFSGPPESHEQDGEKLSRVTVERGMRAASGDPAMAFRALPCRKRRSLSALACRRQRHRRRINTANEFFHSLTERAGHWTLRGINYRRMPSFSIKVL
jgi:hypothetical protein